MKTQNATSPELDSKRVLLVDDDPSVVSSLKRMLRILRPKWNVSAVNSGEEALALFATEHFDAVVSDMSMPGVHGYQVLLHVQECAPGTTRIALSGYADEEWKIRRQTVAQAFLTKPCSAEMVVAAVENPNGIGLIAPVSATGATTVNSHVRRRTSWNDEEAVKFE